MIGEALEPLPGAKSVVLLGYGFGHSIQGRGATAMPLPMTRALHFSRRASAFSLNVTQANFNSLRSACKMFPP